MPHQRAVISMGPERLLRSVRKALHDLRDADKAAQMQRYMKSTMPYHGVHTPNRRRMCKSLFREYALSDADVWRETVLHMWRKAKFREERYAAIELAADRRARDYHTLDALPMFEHMIVDGAWWDYVDELAHRVGEILKREPRAMKKQMLGWSECEDLWKRRSAIICQLRFKDGTDLELLYACIEPSMDSKEFFLQKAIGWALRQYAWTNPHEVRRYCKLNENRLSHLSRREALKNL